jgi:hypothetical protein
VKIDGAAVLLHCTNQLRTEVMSITEPVSALEFLKRARERLAKGWLQGSYAKTANGELVLSSSPDAAMWCLLGALGDDVEAGEGKWGAKQALKKCITELATDAQKLPDSGIFYSYVGIIPQFNDYRNTTQEQVLAVVDCAILKTEEQGK